MIGEIWIVENYAVTLSMNLRTIPQLRKVIGAIKQTFLRSVYAKITQVIFKRTTELLIPEKASSDA